MGNRFDAYLTGRMATEPTLGTTQDGQSWAKFRVAVEDRARNELTGEWEKAQTIFHDVVVFGKLAERTVGALHTGDPGLPPKMWDFPYFPQDTMVAALQAHGQTYLSCGVVAVRDMGVSVDEVAAYLVARDSGRLPVRTDLVLGLPSTAAAARRGSFGTSRPRTPNDA